MKGLILAGGSGRRLRPLTYSGAKQLVPIANRPVLFYVIDNLVAAEIHDIAIIVSSESSSEIHAAVGDGKKFGARCTLIEQDRPGGLAHAVLCAREFLGQDPFVMYLGDNLVGSGIRDIVIEFLRDESTAALALLKEVGDPREFGVAEVDQAGNVTGLVEKPAEPRSNLALVGVYFFRPSIFDAIAEIEPSARGELEITDAIAQVIARGDVCRFVHLTSWWLDIGKKDDVLLANDTILDERLQSGIHGQVDGASEITGRVQVAAGAVVRGSRIRGPVIIGAGAQIVDSVIGPHTAIGERVHIERSRIEHSIIMEEAHIAGIDRIEDSLLGRRVRVTRAAEPGTTVKLLAGDDSVIELIP